MAPVNSALTYRILEYFREQSSEVDPRIRVFIFENADEIGAYGPGSHPEDEEQEKSLQKRAKETASGVGKKAKDVAATAKSVAAVASGFKFTPAHRDCGDVRATLKEMERTFRAFRRSTQIATEDTDNTEINRDWFYGSS